MGKIVILGLCLAALPGCFRSDEDTSDVQQETVSKAEDKELSVQPIDAEQGKHDKNEPKDQKDKITEKKEPKKKHRKKDFSEQPLSQAEDPALADLKSIKKGSAEKTPESIYDRALQRIRIENKISKEEKKQCMDTFKKYYESLTKKYGTRNNTKFAEPDRTEFYINAVKMAFVNPQYHGGWPFHSSLRHRVLGNLKKRIEEEEDPFIMFCALFPVIDYEDRKYALDLYRKMAKKDSFLAQKAVEWLKYQVKRRGSTSRKEFLKAVDAENESAGLGNGL